MTWHAETSKRRKPHNAEATPAQRLVNARSGWPYGVYQVGLNGDPSPVVIDQHLKPHPYGDAIRAAEMALLNRWRSGIRGQAQIPMYRSADRRADAPAEYVD